MPAKILDGKQCAAVLQEKICLQLQARTTKGLRAPGLAVVLVGNHTASQIYVQRKQEACEAVGMRSERIALPETVSTQNLMDEIDVLNTRNDIDGILIQLPLPAHIDTNVLLERIHPHKDVDGFHPYNLGRLAQKRPLLRPCTPWGIMQLLQYYQISVAGLNAVVLGTSNIVGRPMALELVLAQATVTLCNSQTQNLAEHIQRADILISAMGNPHVVQAEWIKPGAIVCDVGMNRLSNGKVCGDLPHEGIAQKAAWLTPVPGGDGPMTVTTLLQNTLMAADLFHTRS